MSDIITFIASFLVWVMFLGLIILFVVDGKKKKEIALHAALSSVLAWVVSQMIKTLFPTQRPFWTNGRSLLTLTVPLGSSFPSVHSAVAFALAVTVSSHNKRLGKYFYVAAFLVASGRYLSNAHSVYDVVGGALLGVMVGLAVNKIHLPT